MVLFPKALFLVTNFTKIIKNSIAIELSSKNFPKFPAIGGFLPNGRKINTWFMNSFQTDVKIMHFSQFS